MGEESTQLDLSNELDRLSAMNEEADDGEGVRVQIGTTRLDPDGIEGHQLVGVAVDSDDASLRGSRWEHPLHDCHREGVTFEIDGEAVGASEAFDAVGGPDLSVGYVLDRATGVVSAIDGRSDDTLELRVIDAPAEAESTANTTHERPIDRLRDASRPGFDDGARFRTFGPLGRPLDPATVE